MKKILHIINGLNLGGAETALYRLLSVTSQEEYTYHIIVLGAPGHYSLAIEALEIPIHYLFIHKNNLFKSFYKLLSLIRQIKPDIVQTWLYHSDFMGGIAAKLCRVKKIIWSIRCEGTGLKPATTKIRQSCALLSWIIPHIVLCNSQAAATNHIRMRYCPQKIRVLYNGFDTVAFAPTKPRAHVSFEKKEVAWKNHLLQSITTPAPIYIGTLARFHEDKDYANLIQTIDIVCTQHPNVYFVLCGQGLHHDNNLLQAMLKPIHHRKNIILINGIDDAPLYLNQIDIFVLSSKTESFPNSLAEAMSCGLPCIATNVGEVNNVLGDTGLLISKENSKELAAACLTMVQKSLEERTLLGATARARIEQNYSMVQHKKQMRSIYQQ